MTPHQKIKTDLHIFLSITATLLIIGGLFVYSASSVYALEHFVSSLYYVKRQLVGLVIGLAGIIALQIIPVSLIKKITPLLFLGSCALTTLTLLSSYAQRIHGSSRWLSLGFVTFQPSELLKMSLILYLAYCLEKQQIRRYSFVYGYLPFLMLLSIPSFILLKQPDFGLTVTLALTTFIVLFIAQFKAKHLIITLLSLIPAGITLVILRPYRLQRVITFLNPWHDPQGAGFQIIQSLIAIGSGNVWGTGIAHSKQKFFYLPMQHTDFIFSIIAEETGFVGCLFLIMLYLLFLYFGMRIAGQIKNKFAQFTILGFVILVNLQALINIAVATGLMPTKGMGLPFVSYGNTSLVCNLWMIGLIIAMVRKENSE